MTNPEAGWYPDPDNAAQMRYFDGSQWTDHYHDGGAASAPSSQASATTVAGQLSGPGPLLSQAWAGVRRRIGLLLGITAGAIAATVVLGFILFALIGSLENNSSNTFNDLDDFSSTSGAAIIGFVVAYVLLYAIWLIWGLMSSRIMVDHFRGVEPSFESAWDVSRRRCLAYLRSWFGVIMLAYIGLGVIFLILVLIDPWALILLIAPFLFFWVKTAFMPVAAVSAARTEDMVIASTDLSKGDRFMPMLGRLVMLSLPLIGLFVVLMILGRAGTPPGLALVVMVVGGFIAWSIFVAGSAKLYIEAGGSQNGFVE